MVIKYIFDVGAPEWEEPPTYEYNVPRHIVEPLLVEYFEDSDYPINPDSTPIDPFDDFDSEEPYSVEDYVDVHYHELLDIDYIKEYIEDVLYSDFYELAYEEYMENEANQNR